MRSLAAVCFVTAAGVGCSLPVAVQPLPASDVPVPLRPSPASVGLHLDVARVPDELAVHDSFDSPLCAFTRYPLAVRESVTRSVVDTISATAREVRLLDTPMRHWNLRNEDLDAALVVRVEAFTVALSPMRKMVGAEFEAKAVFNLSVAAVTETGHQTRQTLAAAAMDKAVDRWGFGGCGRGVAPASRAAERAIRDAITELAAWTAETLRSVQGPQEGSAE